MLHYVVHTVNIKHHLLRLPASAPRIISTLAMQHMMHEASARHHLVRFLLTEPDTRFYFLAIARTHGIF